MTDDCHLFLRDAANFPGGHASGLVRPQSIGEVIDALASASAILPIGAQSSLTGGATPMGEVILTTSGMTRILDVSPQRITVEPGVSVASMQEALTRIDAWFPPAPTFTGATAGGVVATNAAGAATFKFGSTRDWVESLTVVLADGTVLEVTRGTNRAEHGRLHLDTRSGRVEIPVPTYRMPRVAKRSAGYHATADMDLIDLFIGSEGTLGVIVRVTFAVRSPVPASAWAFVPCEREREAVDLVRELREASLATWQTGDPAGIDVSAIEHFDRRSLEMLKEDGVDRQCNLTIPARTSLALLVQLELPADTGREAAFEQIAGALSADGVDSGLARFCRALDKAGVLDTAEIALPGDRRRIDELVAAREAVPAGVNQRVSQAKLQVDARIEKTAADMIVPFERFADMMDVYRAGFDARSLDYAIWGHISDGNVHPNVIPRSFEDVRKGKEAILEFGAEVARLGGCPLAEHGVGRNPVKQALLRQLYGATGIDEMRAVKRALDPEWKLAPGVIFIED